MARTKRTARLAIRAAELQEKERMARLAAKEKKNAEKGKVKSGQVAGKVYYFSDLSYNIIGVVSKNKI